MCRIRLRLQLGFVRSLIEFSPRGAGSPEAERSAESPREFLLFYRMVSGNLKSRYLAEDITQYTSYLIQLYAVNIKVGARWTRVCLCVRARARASRVVWLVAGCPTSVIGVPVTLWSWVCVACRVCRVCFAAVARKNQNPSGHIRYCSTQVSR